MSKCCWKPDASRLAQCQVATDVHLVKIQCLCIRAKSLQSCSALCGCIDCGPPGSSVHGILQARTLEGLPCPPPGDLPDSGIEPLSLMSPALASRFFTTLTTWEAHICKKYVKNAVSIKCNKVKHNKITVSDFPGFPVVKTPSSHCRQHRFNPWLGKVHMLHSVAKK